MKTRKTISMFTLFLVLFLVLTACDTGTSTAATTAGTTKTTAAATTEESLYTPVGTYPIVTKPIELRMFMSMGTQTDYDTNLFTLYIEEKTGIDIIFETAAGEAATEKLNLLLSTKDYPDLIFSRIDENKYGTEEGLLIDLTPYLDIMPNYKTEIAKRPLLLSAMKAIDGKQYYLPSLNECYHCQHCGKMWVNNKHLEDMGEEIPTTIDEFYDLCIKFKEYKPDGVPVFGLGAWAGDPYYFLAGSYLYISDSVYCMVIKDDTISTTAAKPEYRELLKFLRKLYAEKLLNEDAYTIDEASGTAYIATADEPVLFCPTGASFPFYSEASPEVYGHYYPISPLKGPEGFQTCMLAGGMTPRNGVTITNVCQYPEAAVRFCDYFYTFEGQVESQTGPEKGVHWDDPQPGDVGIDGTPALYRRYNKYTASPQNISWLDRGLLFTYSELKLGEASDPGDLADIANMEVVLYLSTRDLYVPYGPKEGDFTTLPPIKLTGEETASIQTISVEIDKYISESRVQFVTGALDINNDSAWETYVNGLTNMGMPTLLEVYQKAYDRMYK